METGQKESRTGCQNPRNMCYEVPVKMAAMGPEGGMCRWEGGKQQTADTEEGKSAELDFGQAKRVREKEKETSKTRLWSVKLDW